MTLDYTILSNMPSVKNVYTTNLPSTVLNSFFEYSNIPKFTKIDYLWFDKAYQMATIITSNHIEFFNRDKSSEKFYFNRISRIYFSTDMQIYFYDLDDKRCGIIPFHYFGFTSKNVVTQQLREDFKLFFYKKFAKTNSEEIKTRLIDEVFKKLEAINDKFDYDNSNQDEKEKYANEIIELYDGFMNNEAVKSEIYFTLEYQLVVALSIKNENAEALKIIDKILMHYSDKIDVEEWHALNAAIYCENNTPEKAIHSFEIAYSLSTDTIAKLDYKKQINEIIKNYNSNFLNLPISERKLILMSNSFQGMISNSFTVLDMKNLPGNLKFPLNHPQKNELYIVHPYITNSYLLFSSYEENLSTNKLNEFFKVAQSLGAKSMIYKSVNTVNTETVNASKLNVDASLGLGKSVIKNTGSIEFEREKHSSNTNGLMYSVGKRQNWEPKKSPYIEENLIWYPHELGWNSLYQQRLNGNIIRHEEVISSKSSLSIGNNEKTSIKAALKTFFIEANVDVNYDINETFNQTETNDWKIEIEFESIENLKEKHIALENTSENIPLLNQTKEAEYLEEIKHALEDDGIIDAKERSYLERFRKRIGLSENAAEMLENSLLNKTLNSIEKEYLEEYNEIVEDGILSEKDRRTLDRVAMRLQLSAERVIELEKNYNN